MEGSPRDCRRDPSRRHDPSGYRGSPDATRTALLALEKTTSAARVGVASSGAFESLTGRTGPDVVRTSMAIAVIVGALLFWRFAWPSIRDEHEAERGGIEAFIVNTRCPRCGRALTARRVHHPVMDKPGYDRAGHWLHACKCGEMTLYKPDGSAVHVEMGDPDERGVRPAAGG